MGGDYEREETEVLQKRLAVKGIIHLVTFVHWCVHVSLWVWVCVPVDV